MGTQEEGTFKYIRLIYINTYAYTLHYPLRDGHIIEDPLFNFQKEKSISYLRSGFIVGGGGRGEGEKGGRGGEWDG